MITRAAADHRLPRRGAAAAIQACSRPWPQARAQAARAPGPSVTPAGATAVAIWRPALPGAEDASDRHQKVHAARHAHGAAQHVQLPWHRGKSPALALAGPHVAPHRLYSICRHQPRSLREVQQLVGDHLGGGGQRGCTSPQEQPGAQWHAPKRRRAKARSQWPDPIHEWALLGRKALQARQAGPPLTGMRLMAAHWSKPRHLPTVPGHPLPPRLPHTPPFPGPRSKVGSTLRETTAVRVHWGRPGSEPQAHDASVKPSGARGSHAAGSAAAALAATPPPCTTAVPRCAAAAAVITPFITGPAAVAT